MRVLTWNLWWRFGEWEARQQPIADELVRVDPDVALLQEVWSRDDRDQAIELAEAGGYHVARTMSADGGPQRFGNAILSRWPITVVEQIALAGEPPQPSYRTALACRIDAPHGQQLAVVTHLTWQYDKGELRQAQLAEVVDLIDRHRDRDEETAAPPILAGDLNAVPDADEIRRLVGTGRPYVDGLVFTDCWVAVGDGPGITWTRDNPNSAEAMWPRRRLDYVFVAWPRPKPLGNPLSAELVGVAPRGGVVPSDHYGVVVELDDRPPYPDDER